MSAKRVGLGERPAIIGVAVNLVGGGDDNGAGGVGLCQSLQEIVGTRDVGRKCSVRITVSPAHQRLGCQVKDDFGLGVRDQAVQLFRIADVGSFTRQTIRRMQMREQGFGLLGLQ